MDMDDVMRNVIIWFVLSVLASYCVLVKGWYVI